MSFWQFYQNLPQYINPIAVTYWVLSVLIISRKNKILKFPISNFQFSNNFQLSNDQFQNLFLYILMGILLGSRFGYVIFYNFSYYLQNPLEIFLPIHITGYGLRFVGFYGMSYFGALLGAVWAGYFFAQKYKIDFWNLADFVSVAIPAGYFFGRIGNFLNGELYGRPTDSIFGMYFPAGGNVLRHPSQLYEAFFEGIILFFVLIFLRKLLRKQLQNYYFPGILFLVYIFGYAFFRFFLEFFRAPDSQIGLFFNWLSLGQSLSLGAMFGVLFVFAWRKKGNVLE
ncbi:MAG: Prolipoprotein diacylglyceryl transferase [Parcubacteria group bacterium Athens0714_25]|nr:MAG: Prolipoprotein diacylglyceryl transferase [Parcubacteria group bacterium Athens0714_25]